WICQRICRGSSGLLRLVHRKCVRTPFVGVAQGVEEAQVIRLQPPRRVHRPARVHERPTQFRHPPPTLPLPPPPPPPPPPASPPPRPRRRPRAAAGILPLPLRRPPIPGPLEVVRRQRHPRADLPRVAPLGLGQSLLAAEPVAVPSRLVPGHHAHRTILARDVL